MSDRRNDVPIFSTVMTQPGMIAPDWSRTVPRIVPKVDCPNTTPLISIVIETTIKTARDTKQEFIMLLSLHLMRNPFAVAMPRAKIESFSAVNGYSGKMLRSFRSGRNHPDERRQPCRVQRDSQQNCNFHSAGSSTNPFRR